MIPYRDVAPIASPFSPRRTWWRRLRCLFLASFTLGWLGHRWRILRENPSRTAALVHLHPLAGCDAVCERCGTHWLDAEYGGEKLFARETLRAAGSPPTEARPPRRMSE